MKFKKRSKEHYSIGIDIGGTKILTALLNKRFRVLTAEKGRLDAHQGEKHFLKTVLASVSTVMKQKNISRREIKAVGIGCPGMIDHDRGSVKLSPNISFLKNYPLAKKIEKNLKIPVVLENDVNAGLYGEYQFGAARGYQHIAGIFLGTGVGGAFILNGKLYSGADGGAGEIGHTYLELPSFLKGIDARLTLEALTGRLAIATDASLLLMKQQALHLFQDVEFDIKQIKSKALAKAIKAGDRSIETLIEDKARILGIAMANVVNLLNPELIVLGGGLMEAMGNRILPVAKKIMEQYALAPLVKSVKVLPAELKDYAVLMGAAGLAFQKIHPSK